MRTHATSCIGETGLKILNGFLIFLNGFPIFLNGFQFSSTAFRFPRNPRKSIYGEKYTKDHYLSFVFFATRSPTRAPSFVIPATIPNTPPWTQRSVHCQALCHGGATAKSVCSISRGRDPESSAWIVFFIFFNYLFSLLNYPLFPHTISVPQEPRQPIDGLPPLLLYFLSR